MIQTCLAITLVIVTAIPLSALATGFNLGAFWKKKSSATAGLGSWTSIPGEAIDYLTDMLGLYIGLGGGLQQAYWTDEEIVFVISGVDGPEGGSTSSGTRIKVFNTMTSVSNSVSNPNYGYWERYDGFRWLVETLSIVMQGHTFESQSAKIGSKLVFRGITSNDHGFVYDLTNGTWTAINAPGEPVRVVGYSVVSTGTELIYWGGKGIDSGAPYSSGGRYDPNTNQWHVISTTNAPSNRTGHQAVWTGQEMIVWGGVGAGWSFPNTGGRYNPATNTWQAMSTVGAPQGRYGHTAIWTGQEMIVWGGTGSDFNAIATGARYNPSTDTWSPISEVGAPEPTSRHVAYWTGSKMLVWAFLEGKLYDPATDTWSDMAPLPNDIRRLYEYLYESIDTEDVMSSLLAGLAPVTAFNGSKLLVWTYMSRYAAIYDLSTNTWQSFASFAWGLPDPRPDLRFHDDLLITSSEPELKGVWAGSHLITWGGFGLFGAVNWGDRFNPDTGLWSHMSTVGAPEARGQHSLTSTGSKVLVWGGAKYTLGSDEEAQYFNTGGVYDVASDSWASMSVTNAPSARSQHAAVWMGDKMFVWGGKDGDGVLSSGALYNLATNSWTSISNSGAPSARYGAQAFWTGSKVIVWGGA